MFVKVDSATAIDSEGLLDKTWVVKISERLLSKTWLRQDLKRNK